MTKQYDQKIQIEKEVVQFNDGTSLSIFYENRGEARLAMMDGVMPEAIRALKRNIRLKAGICCEELRNNLGNRDLDPRIPVLLTEKDLANGLEWRYPGATKPGFYFLRYLQPTLEEEHRDNFDPCVYVPMDSCPYCYAEPFSKDLSENS